MYLGCTIRDGYGSATCQIKRPFIVRTELKELKEEQNPRIPSLWHEKSCFLSLDRPVVSMMDMWNKERVSFPSCSGF